MEDLITAKRLRWLGHVARMDEERIPKKLLFGWLPERRPAYGTMRSERERETDLAIYCWRDRVRKDLKRFGIVEKRWYATAQDRGSWRGQCRAALKDATERRLEEDEQRRARKAADHAGVGATAMPFKCDTCQRTFRRRQDISQHRCVTTRPKGQVMTRPPS